jgi:hypothetical protein
MAKIYRFRMYAQPATVSKVGITIEYGYLRSNALSIETHECTLAEIHGRFETFCASLKGGPTKAVFCGMANPNDRKPPGFSDRYERPTVVNAPEVTA